MSPINKEQLYSEETFIHFCERDEFSGRKLPRRVSKEFLLAAEKDGLIVPLLIEKGKRKKEDGTDEEVDIRYYSPFQIFLVAGLINNEIDGDELRSPDNWDWYKEKGTRYITWGDGSSSWVEHYKAKRSDEPQPMEYNIFAIADDFHKVIHLIHGLKAEDRYERIGENRRLFTRAPLLAYNLDSIEKSYVDQYGLNPVRLKRVIAAVGSLATGMDPLERWFNYIQRHSRTRRDQLKGLASVAQDLYGFCDIAYEIMEKGYAEKLPPLLDFLHPDIKPYLMERAEYASGEDIKAISAAFNKVRDWIKGNADLIEELRPAIEREKLDDALSKIEVRINDYEKRYGDRRYVGSTRRFKPEDKKLEELDDYTKYWAQNLFQQRLKIDEKKGKVSEKDQKEILAYEIAFSIERTLDDIGRSVSNIAHQIAEATWPLHYKAEREKELSHVPALKEFGEKVPRTDPEYARKHHEFWTKGMKEYEKPHQERLDRLDRVRSELHGIGGQTRLAFCAACRKNPVQLHYAHLDRQISHEAVCDECLESEKKKAMSGTAEERKKMKYAEWLCDYCGAKVLLKFAVGNTISVTTQNNVPIQLSLEYGRLDLQAKCPDCGETSDRPIDWGWIS